MMVHGRKVQDALRPMQIVRWSWRDLEQPVDDVLKWEGRRSANLCTVGSCWEFLSMKRVWSEQPHEQCSSRAVKAGLAWGEAGGPGKKLLPQTHVRWWGSGSGKSNGDVMVHEVRTDSVTITGGCWWHFTSCLFSLPTSLTFPLHSCYPDIAPHTDCYTV